MNFIKKIFAKKGSKDQKKDDFSEFFTVKKAKYKAKIIRRVLDEATEDQRRMMRKYEEKVKTT